MPVSDIPIVTTSSGISEFGNVFKNILAVITSPELQSQLLTVKIVFLAFSAAFLVMIIYLAITTTFLDWLIISDIKNFFFPKFFERRNLIKNWKKIKKGLEKKFEAQWKLAVIEAVRFFDHILEEVGYSAETFDEKVKKLQADEITTWKSLLAIQDVCRDIMRDPNYKISRSKAKETIGVLEKTLVDLEVF